jgi:hypothetical protein
MRWVTRLGVVPVVVVLLLIGAVHAVPAPKTVTGGVLAITQSSRVSEQQSFTVSVQVADPANVTQAFFLFCQLTSSKCYLPVPMTLHGTNWFVGTTNPMTSYRGMSPGVVAGYNVSLDYRDGVNVTYPSLPNPFTNLTISTTVTGEYMFEMSVAPMGFGLSGVVHDSATGKALSGASVSLLNSSGSTNSTTTASTGGYSFAGVSNGTYQLTVSAPGFQTSSESLKVAGQSTQANFALTNPSEQGPPPAKSGWSAGLTQPVVLGSIVGVVVLGLAALLVYRRRRGPPSGPAARSGDASATSPPGPT